MTIEIKVPVLGESITEATVGRWFKKPGEAVKADEPLVELETDKVTVEVPAPAAGVMGDILAAQGATVAIGALLGALKEGGSAAAAAAVAPKPAKVETAKAAAKSAPAKAAPASAASPPPAPAARKVLAEAQIDAGDVEGSGRRGQVLKEDAVEAVSAKAAAPVAAPVPAPPPRRESPSTPVPVAIQALKVPSTVGEPGREERVKMTRLRQTIARRLKDAQNSAAMLTTFNDVDMSAVMALRAQYKDLFEKRHGVKLGFMGFFVKACVQALREIPAVNAEIDGDDIIYKN
jgi:2-oxoglutarate dehydrogenase E2 component (dihydrolipoamide succinyltransferase)